MPAETIYADLVLAVAALVAGVLYLRARRRHKAKKAGPPVRPATPTPRSAVPPASSPIQAPGVTTWAPPPPATPGAAVAPTVIASPTACAKLRYLRRRPPYGRRICSHAGKAEAAELETQAAA